MVVNHANLVVKFTSNRIYTINIISIVIILSIVNAGKIKFYVYENIMNEKMSVRSC